MQSIQPIKSNNIVFRQHLLLYKQVIKCITNCEANVIGLPLQIDNCFNLVVSFLHTFVQEISIHCFESYDQKSAFFKKIQPVFDIQTPYYKLLGLAKSYARQAANHEKLSLLWQKQQQLLSCFKQRNAAFYAWYIQAQNDSDSIWFTQIAMQGNDGFINYSHQALVAELVALKKEKAYAGPQLRHAYA